MSLIGDFHKSMYRPEQKPGYTLCPDCEPPTYIPEDEFVPHRERAHPPSHRVISIPGVPSNERHGYQED